MHYFIWSLPQELVIDEGLEISEGPTNGEE